MASVHPRKRTEWRVSSAVCKLFEVALGPRLRGKQTISSRHEDILFSPV